MQGRTFASARPLTDDASFQAKLTDDIDPKVAEYLGIAGIVLLAAAIVHVTKDRVKRKQQKKDKREEVAQLDKLVGTRSDVRHRRASVDSIQF